MHFLPFLLYFLLQFFSRERIRVRNGNFLFSSTKDWLKCRQNTEKEREESLEAAFRDVIKVNPKDYVVYKDWKSWKSISKIKEDAHHHPLFSFWSWHPCFLFFVLFASRKRLTSGKECKKRTKMETCTWIHLSHSKTRDSTTNNDKQLQTRPGREIERKKERGCEGWMSCSCEVHTVIANTQTWQVKRLTQDFLKRWVFDAKQSIHSVHHDRKSRVIEVVFVFLLNQLLVNTVLTLLLLMLLLLMLMSLLLCCYCCQV